MYHRSLFYVFGAVAQDNSAGVALKSSHINRFGLDCVDSVFQRPREFIGGFFPSLAVDSNHIFIKIRHGVLENDGQTVKRAITLIFEVDAGSIQPWINFIELICDGFGQSPAATIQDVTYELTTFFENGRHPDDITITLLHRLAE